MTRAWMGRIGMVAGLVLAGSACNCGPAVTATLPWFEVDTEDLPYGLVALGDVVEQAVNLQSRSSAEVTVSLRIEGDGASAFTFKEPPPTIIGGNQSVSVTLVFTPTEDTTYAATLVVESNGEPPGRKNVRIFLSGEGKRAIIAVRPDELRLTAVACAFRASPPAACLDQRVVTIENVGLVPLRLGAVDLVGASEPGPGPDGLRLASNDASSALLEPGGSVEVPVRWQPGLEQVGETLARLRVESNDLSAPETFVPIIANATPNAKPEGCIQVERVQRRVYVRNQNGSVVVQRQDVPKAEWTDPERPGVLVVRPGYGVRLTSKKLDANEEANDPCTFDPEDDTLSYNWSFSGKPVESRVLPNPTGQFSTEFEVDAEGAYEVTLAVRDTVNTAPGLATLQVDAIPRDDLFVQLSWQDESAQGADLDLHLLVDRGPNVEGAGELFCQQDAFVFHAQPRWFEHPDCFLSPPGPNCEETVTNDPRYLLDDIGTGPRLESIALGVAPFDTRFRVAVHYYGGTTRTVSPAIRLRLKGQEFGPFRPTTPLTAPGDVWIAATLTFPPEVAAPEPQPNPTATELQVRHAASDPGYPYPTDLLGIEFETAVCQ